MSAWEWVGVITSVICVVLCVRRSIWNWPIGIVSVIAFGVFFWQLKLYADVGLQVFFLVTGFWGWWLWLHGGADHGELPVRRLSARARGFWVLVMVPAIWLVATLLRRYTDASLPYWDTLNTALQVAAQLLLMAKYMENWPLWIAADVLSIGIYLAKGANPTAGLYVLLLVLACLGMAGWLKEVRGSCDARPGAG